MFPMARKCESKKPMLNKNEAKLSTRFESRDLAQEELWLSLLICNICTEGTQDVIHVH